MKEEEDNKPKLTGRGGPNRGQGRKKGSRNKTPSKRLIEDAVCLHFGFDKEAIEEAKVELLQMYLKSGDKGLAYFCEILFGKPTDVVKLEADIKVTSLKTEDDVEGLFDEDENESDDEEED